MTPVILLTDGYLANGAEPWLVPERRGPARHHGRVPHRSQRASIPYLRDDRDAVRARGCVPGTPGLEHRIGGLEKEHVTGNVSYAPANHEQMVRMRARKIAGIAARDPADRDRRRPQEGDLLVLGWGSTYGAIASAVKRAARQGKAVAHVHLRYLNPLPPDLGDILGRFKKVLVPEMNLGQLVKMLRAEYLVDAIGSTRSRASRSRSSEIVTRIQRLLRRVEG